MTFVPNNNQQLTFMDSIFHPTKREKRFLENHGQKYLLKELPNVFTMEGFGGF